MGNRESPPRADAEALLARLLGSPLFAQSMRMRDLLTFLVRESLDSGSGELKESVIASEVFGKTDYDPKTDSLVRVSVAGLRSKLLEYFSGPGKDEPLLIEIPKGSYLPVFHSRKKQLTTSRREVIVAGAAATAVVPAFLIWQHRRPAGDRIVVLPFLDLTAEKNLGYFCDGLTEELIDRLAGQQHIDVIARTSAFHFKDRREDIRTIGR